MILVLSLLPGAALADGVCRITTARYDTPTDRYPHGALGDPYEWGALVLERDCGAALRVTLPQELVFEDTAPRLADLDGDGAPEVVTVESHRDRGARLAVWGLASDGATARRLAATPAIGQRNRWLAPLGAADLDGDGRVELAYVDRPHLARVLRVWRWQEDALQPVAQRAGLTNHVFGQDRIEGGIRLCPGQPPEMVLADAGWARLQAVRLTGGALVARDIGAYDSAALAGALACR